MKSRTSAAVLALFALNVFVTLPLFGVDYTRQMGSIEAAYISLARYIRDHFPHLDWFPLWYGGIPFRDAYVPLLPFLLAAVSAVARISPGLAYHFVTATIYALAPVAMFWAACRLGAGRAAALGAALGYSLVSPSCWLIRVLRFDSGGWFGPRRLVTLVRYGEGPHITSLLFLPLAIGLVDVALEKRRPQHYILAALALAAVVLSNWIGAFALALALIAYMLSGIHKSGISAWLRTAAICLYAYAIALPWVTPSAIATIRTNAPRLVGFKTFAGYSWLVLGTLTLLVFAAWALKKWQVPAGIRFGVLFLYGPAVITLGAYWFRIFFLPQPERYHLEMDMALWMMLAIIAGRRHTSPIAAVVLALACIPLIAHQHAMAREMERPIAIQSTAEYKISRWLGKHMPGHRVFAPGTVSFWMNAFSDTPMLDGADDNGIRNSLLWGVNFQILFGDKLPVAIDWLKAFGCDAVVGGDPESREVYHPFAHPDKLHRLREIWRDGPEVIYAVPRRNASLAHAVRAADLVAEVPPAYDTKALVPYLAALDDPALPAADFKWRGGDASSGAATITADLRPEHLLSIQVAYDQGWRARVNGQPRPVRGDKLGQIVVEPHCNGRCVVELAYDGSLEMRVARWISRLALAGGALWMVSAVTLCRKPGRI